MGVEWVPYVSGGEVPSNAIKGGHEANGTPLYICRAEIQEGGQKCGTHPGKFGETTGRGGLIPYGGKEHYVPKVEILCGDENSVRWQDDDGVLNVEGKNLVQGGTHTDGQPIYICQCDFEGGLFPGKTAAFMNGGTFSYGGNEVNDVQNYRVLVYA